MQNTSVKKYYSISELVEQGISEQFLRRIVHSSKANTFTFRTSPKGKHLIDYAKMEELIQRGALK